MIYLECSLKRLSCTVYGFTTFFTTFDGKNMPKNTIVYQFMLKLICRRNAADSLCLKESE